MLMVKKLMMLVVWAVCFINLVHPFEAPLNTLFYIVLAVVTVLHAVLVALVSKAITLDGKARFNLFVFGSIAMAAMKKDLLGK
ncbi:DUF1145 domain-containing protein [Gallaecimonas pentaromativorans]|uniref:Uncharacterized protein YhhL (DUF1145 family) n=1 Tax=Gallaecimonas pentaromativorans TaxID=584787 RepID=A0A3N1NZ78_9GAMM|nr:DUF1145 domain-containing protein [Gallaecimonas pentaromativorans]MED5525319.1 DUF1145 domain-containing protein [Pseudomonadota bacterium]ROQ24282.1 uncharacterized protein YhhL (DUF1145 family) [Gallaecimonas pentaromativorans]